MNSTTSTNSELSLSQVKALQSCLEQATTHTEQQEWEAAINCYQKATAINPYNANAYHHWEDALVNLQRWEEAVGSYRRALAIDPNLEWFHYNLAEVLSGLELWEEAIVNLIISVSFLEQQRFLDYGYQQVSVLGHFLPSNPTPNDFNQRQGILFVSSLYLAESPNADSVIWLTEEIFPLIQTRLNQEIQLFIAGNNQAEAIKQHIEKLNNSALKMLGIVDDLPHYYNQTCLFIAPTRFATGIPHKVHEAIAYGLPIVTTSLIAGQLLWTNETELLVADDIHEFAEQCIRLYQNAEL